MRLAGIDFAWVPESNGTAIAIGRLSEKGLCADTIFEQLYGMDSILSALDAYPDLQGIAIDASLVINNQTGQRLAEREVSRDYGAKRAGCHATNLTLYPAPASVELAKQLDYRGFCYFGQSEQERSFIECYPHPAIILKNAVDFGALLSPPQAKVGGFIGGRWKKCPLVKLATATDRLR
ncbi:hypothetical protein BVY04_04160, partial [bacterium M21]